MLNEADLDELRDIAINAGLTAAGVIMAGRGHHGTVESKAGASSAAMEVVTEVDRRSQAVILEVLEESQFRYGLGLLAEENAEDGSRLIADAFWCVDPLDGTLPFVEGRAGFAVSIALVSREAEPLIGVAVDPISGTVYHARRGGGAWRDGDPFTIAEPSDRLHFCTDKSFMAHPNYAAVVAALDEIAADCGYAGVDNCSSAGAVLHAMWTIERAPGVYFKFPKADRGGGALWDYSATSCIYKELGAPHGDIRGKPLPLNRPDGHYMNPYGICYASDPALAQQVYRLFERLG
ncbi:MAG: inositol monophosphatase [Planctomycetota bacterium]|jgi:myo-inositol-1(or 4)-monophosphatase|nr:inositol monophosphatase [Planctomycetota bacterium]